MYNFQEEIDNILYDITYEVSGGIPEMEFKVKVNNDPFDFKVTEYMKNIQIAEIEYGKHSELFDKITSKVMNHYKNQQRFSSVKG